MFWVAMSASKYFCLFMVLWNIRCPLAQRKAQRTVGEPFPTCANVEEKCAMPMGCTEVRISPLSHSDEYSPDNVLCVDNNSPAAYRLIGCPSEFYDTSQKTNGTCVTSDVNGTDLYLTASELVPGHHPLNCVANDSRNGVIFSSAIVATDDMPYRDVLMYVNGVKVLQDHWNSTNVNITLDVGDNIRLVIRAVGNVSVINASDARFTCVTGFACNRLTLHAVSNRYVQCSLRTPVEPTDDGRTLAVVIHNVEEEISSSVTINVNDLPLSPPPSVSSSPVTTSDDSQPTSTIGPVIIIEPTTPSTDQDVTSSPKDSVLVGVIAAVVTIVIVGLSIFAVVFYVHKKFKKHKKRLRDSHTHQKTILDTARSMEEASKPAAAVETATLSSHRSSTATNEQQQYTLLATLEKLDNKIDHSIEIVEQTNTGVNALMLDNAKSIKRQVSAE